MKKIIDIATGNKFVQWETLAQPIDDNFAELDETKLDKTSVSQSTGASTGTVMSQKAVTDALEKKIGSENLVQSTGNSTTTAMSQKAVTDALETYGANPSSTNYITCATANSVANKTITILNFKLNNRVRILIQMANANTADNVNLSISSPQLDTKPLYYKGKRASSTNTWNAGAVLDVYYDGTNFQAEDFFGQNFRIIRLGALTEIINAFEDGDWEYPNLSELLPIPVSDDGSYISDSLLDNTIFTCDYMSDEGSTGSVIPVNVEYAKEQPYSGSPAFYDFSFTYKSTFYMFRLMLDGGSFAYDETYSYLVKTDLSNLATPTLYYTETKDAPVNSENYVTSEYPGDPYSSGHDYKIVRFTVAPGAAHTGPSFMLFDGDYNYYAKWPAIGLYPSSDHYFEAGSGYIPKERTPYAKIGATEQVHYKADTKKFYSITL